MAAASNGTTITKKPRGYRVRSRRYGNLTAELSPSAPGTNHATATQNPSTSIGRRDRLRLLAPGDFLGAELRDAFDQLHGHGLGKREADGALVDLVRYKLVLERRDDAPGDGVERVVLLPPGEKSTGPLCSLYVGIL